MTSSGSLSLSEEELSEEDDELEELELELAIFFLLDILIVLPVSTNFPLCLRDYCPPENQVNSKLRKLRIQYRCRYR
jgi:hypothetical protein